MQGRAEWSVRDLWAYLSRRVCAEDQRSLFFERALAKANESNGEWKTIGRISRWVSYHHCCIKNRICLKMFFIYFFWEIPTDCRDGVVAKASILNPVGCWFKPRADHTQNFFKIALTAVLLNAKYETVRVKIKYGEFALGKNFWFSLPLRGRQVVGRVVRSSPWPNLAQD